MRDRRARPQRLMLMAALLTLALIFTYPLLPQRTLTLWPEINAGKAELFADGERGGNSTVAWGDAPGEFICEVKTGPVWQMCGMHIPLGDIPDVGVNLDLYTHVLLDIDYRGQADKLRFYIRNFEVGFSRPGNYESNKFNNVILSTSEFSPPWLASLDLFTVADWWKNDNNVPLHFTAPGFKHAIMFGIDIPAPIASGTHSITLRHIEFVGPLLPQTTWYQIILGMWVGVLLTLALKRYLYLSRQLKKEAQRAASLKSYSRALANKSEKYKQLSEVDQLTGVLNRNGISQELERLYPAGKNQVPVALMLFDLDHFKIFNDRLGHHRGDEILCALSRAIQGNIRAHDSFGRWGGEEFVLLCPDTPLSDALALAEKLRLVAETLALPDIPDDTITISVGVTIAVADETFEDTFKRADAALYQAKRSGRNRVVA